MIRRFLAALAVLALVVAMASCAENVLDVPNFVIHFEEDDELVVEAVREALEFNFDRITGILGVVPPNAIDVFIYPSVAEYHQAVGRPDMQDWMVGTVIDGAIHMVSPANPGPAHDFDSMIKVAVHEFVHVLALELNPHNDRPFLVEGLATYLAEQYEFVDDAIRYMLDNFAMPDVDVIMGFDWGAGIYQAGFAFAKFIATEFGYDKLVELYVTPDIWLVFGMSNDELNTRWMEFLHTNYGG